MRSVESYLIMSSVVVAMACQANDESPSDTGAGATTATATAEVDEDIGGTPRVDCNPVQQDCAAGRNCTLVGNSFQCVVTAVDGAEGATCQEETECGIGLACLARSTLVGCEYYKCCTPLCELSEVDYNCPGAEQGERCAPALTGDVLPAHQGYGVCRL
jgi:hypothetical protein